MVVSPRDGAVTRRRIWRPIAVGHKLFRGLEKITMARAARPPLIGNGVKSTGPFCNQEQVMAHVRPSRIVDLSKEIAYNRDDPFFMRVKTSIMLMARRGGWRGRWGSLFNSFRKNSWAGLTTRSLAWASIRRRISTRHGIMGPRSPTAGAPRQFTKSRWICLWTRRRVRHEAKGRRGGNHCRRSRGKPSLKRSVAR